MIADYVPGIFGGITVVLVGHPFDTTKTRLQTAPPGFYSSTIDCINKTIKWEGLSGFYKGMFSPLGGQMIFRSISFSSFSFFSSLELSADSTRRYFIAGALTGLCISVVEAPIDLLKTKLQIQVFQNKLNPSFRVEYSTVRQCALYTYRTNGISALWQGWRATAIRNIPANALFFPINEIVKEKIALRKGIAVAKLELSDKLLAGACAGISYWVGTYPLDVIKGRIQAMPYGSRVGWFDVALLIWRDGGAKAFTKGLLPCAARAIPACGTMFATVDIVRGELATLMNKNQY